MAEVLVSFVIIVITFMELLAVIGLELASHRHSSPGLSEAVIDNALCLAELRKGDQEVAWRTPGSGQGAAKKARLRPDQHGVMAELTGTCEQAAFARHQGKELADADQRAA